MEISNFGHQVVDLEHFKPENRLPLERIFRSQTQSTYLGDYRSICRILGRFKIFLDTRDHGFSCNVLLDGFWEIWLTIFFFQNIKRGYRVLDIGANFGYYTLLLSDLVGSTGSVEAVEPNPNAASFLSDSIVLNGFSRRTKVIQAAVGRSALSDARLFVPHTEPKNARVIAANEQANEDGIVHLTKQISLEELVGDGDAVDFIKIDAEGAEENILLGSVDYLTKNKPSMILEFNAERSTDAKGFLNTILGIYRSFQYVDFDCQVKNIEINDLLTVNRGHDWLLYLKNSE